MEDGSSNNNGTEKRSRGEIYSKTVRAGKRTYFFDVKSTRRNDYYLTITESKKRFNKEGNKYYFEKHKIFLYNEDFEKFTEGLTEVLDFINESSPEISVPVEEKVTEGVADNYTDVDFDDLEGN